MPMKKVKIILIFLFGINFISICYATIAKNSIKNNNDKNKTTFILSLIILNNIMVNASNAKLRISFKYMK